MSKIISNFAAQNWLMCMLKAIKIADYCSQFHPKWSCEMPEGCPPEDVQMALEHPFFRLTQEANTISEKDFMSYAELNPTRSWGEMLPLAVGLSIINNEAKARKNMKLPMYRPYKGIAQIVLHPQDGVVKQTGVHISHYTWWRTTSFQLSTAKMLAV